MEGEVMVTGEAGDGEAVIEGEWRGNSERENVTGKGRMGDGNVITDEGCNLSLCWQ